MYPQDEVVINTHVHQFPEYEVRLDRVECAAEVYEDNPYVGTRFIKMHEDVI